MRCQGDRVFSFFFFLFISLEGELTVICAKHADLLLEVNII